MGLNKKLEKIAENQIAENQIVVANSLISLLNYLVNLFVKSHLKWDF